MRQRRMPRQELWRSWAVVLWVLAISATYLFQMQRAIWHDYGGQLKRISGTMLEHGRR